MFESVITIYQETGRFLLSWWWLWLPIILFLMLKHLWLDGIRHEFVRSIDWVLLEVRIPREIKKTPKAMEQIFAGLHGIHSMPNFKERNFQGKIQEWLSFEMVSQGGRIHFCIRTPALYKNLVEAQVYAQYPEAEISQVDDYSQLVPQSIPNENYDLWGTELILTKEDAYPIRTYSDFYVKEVEGIEEQVDPLATLLEVLSKLDAQEQIWIQTLIRPVGDDWKKEGERIKNKLLGRESEKEQGVVAKEFSNFLTDAKEVIVDLISGPPSERIEKRKEELRLAPMFRLTKAEQEIVTAVEYNIAKLGYETLIRFVYLAPTNVFSKANISAIIGSYKLFNSQNLNGFMPNKKISPKINYWWQFKKMREFARKRRVLANYKKRFVPLRSQWIKYLRPSFPAGLVKYKRAFVFNIEELATVYHFPGVMVEAPMMPKVEAKKGEPPSGLPTG